MTTTIYILSAIALVLLGYVIGSRVQLESDSTTIYYIFQRIINELKVSSLPDTPYNNGIKNTIDGILSEFGLERDKQEPTC
jgi:hypothetical protein